MSLKRNSKWADSDPSAAHSGSVAESVDLAFCISPPCLSMVDGLVQKTEEAYSATAIWATRRFDIFERLALLLFIPCLASDSPIGSDVGKEAWAAGG